MSSAAFVERRGILANAVAAKAQLYRSTAHRNLLFFLQGLSMENGGLRAVAGDLFDMFPDRVEKGKASLALPPESLFGRPRVISTDRRFVKIGWFAEFLERLCIDPEIDVEELSATESSAAAPYFRDPIGAILEYGTRRNAATARGRVITSIGQEVHVALDQALAMRGITVIEGISGCGKTHAAESWCRDHLGEARFVTLSGITHRTGLFQKIGAALGLAICQNASSKLQAKIELHLERTKLMLVIDEAHFLWPQHQRSRTAPELIDWVNTSLVNNGVPVALICTDQFAKLKSRAEKQTGWTSDQFIHRTSCYKQLPQRPTKDDLRTVARVLLSHRWSEPAEDWVFDSDIRPDRVGVNVVASYAAAHQLPLPTVRSIVENARAIAREDKRDVLKLADVNQALESRQVSDVAVRAAFEQPSRTRKSTAPVPQIDRDSAKSSIERMSNFSPDPLTNRAAKFDSARRTVAAL